MVVDHRPGCRAHRPLAAAPPRWSERALLDQAALDRAAAGRRHPAERHLVRTRTRQCVRRRPARAQAAGERAPARCTRRHRVRLLRLDERPALRPGPGRQPLREPGTGTGTGHVALAGGSGTASDAMVTRVHAGTAGVARGRTVVALRVPVRTPAQHAAVGHAAEQPGGHRLVQPPVARRYARPDDGRHAGPARQLRRPAASEYRPLFPRIHDATVRRPGMESGLAQHAAPTVGRRIRQAYRVPGVARTDP